MSPTHDMIIDNSTGANVRADINNALAALVSNSSSSSEPSTKYAYMWWADTTNGVLKIRNSANNAWVELLQLDGTLTLEDGSASTPALAFRDDLNTGIFSSAADTFNVATGGSERMRVDSSGNVGINQVPTRELSLHSPNNNNALIHFTNDDTGETSADGVLVGLDGNENMVINNQETGKIIYFSNGGSERMRIDSSGNVSIGTSATGRKLTVADASGAILELTSNTATATSAVYLHEGAIGGTTNGGAIQYNGSNNSLILSCGTTLTTEALRITRGDRFVGIGQGSSYNPAVPLEVRNPAGTTPTSGNFVLLRLCAQHNSARGLDIGTGRPTSGNQNDAGVFYNARDTESSGYAAQHVFQRAGNNVMVIGYTANNHVGIGTNSPDYTLDVEQGGGTSSPLALARFRQTTNDDTESATIMIMRHAAALTGQNGVDIVFQNSAGTTVGKIDHGQSTTQYRTSSDYRLKENAVAISDGITRLKTLKPYRFNFIAEPDRTVDGFFAHEVTAVPEAISGTKDEVETTYYKNGDDIPEGKAVGDVKSTTSPVYQGIDQSKLVPLLVAAVQELIAKVETLEAA